MFQIVFKSTRLLVTSIEFVRCYHECREKFFCHQDHKKSITQSNGMWLAYFLFGFIHWEIVFNGINMKRFHIMTSCWEQLQFQFQIFFKYIYWLLPLNYIPDFAPGYFELIDIIFPRKISFPCSIIFFLLLKNDVGI